MPVGQALISGYVVTVTVATICLLAGWPLLLAPTAGAAALALAWFALLSDRRPWAPVVEDDPEPRPARVVHEVELVIDAGAARLTRFVELPEGIDGQTMRQLARAIRLPGGAFSRPYLCRHKRILSQTQYHDLRRAWLRAGLVADLPGNRTKLTAAGRAVLRSYE